MKCLEPNFMRPTKNATVPMSFLVDLPKSDGGSKNVNPDHHGFMTWMVRFHGWYIGSDHGHGTWHGCHDPDGHFLMIPMMVMVHVMDGHQKP